MPYHRDGVLFAGPRDAFSVRNFISSFSSSNFRLFRFYFFFCRFIVYQYIVSYQFSVSVGSPRCVISIFVVAVLRGTFYVRS